VAITYKRLTSGYNYEKTSNAVTGKEVYIRHDDAAGAVPFASLPVINSTPFTDPDGNTASNCLCQKIIGRFIDSDPNTIQYEFQFTTDGTAGGGGGQPGSDVNTDPATRRYVMGGESVTVDSPDEAGWWWSLAPQNPIRQPISKVIVTGSFTIPKGPLTPAEDATFWTTVIGLIGKINNAAFDGRFRQGSVLFEGIDGGTVYNDGVLSYQYNMNFSFRIINDLDAAGNPIAADDWNYLWREDNAGWDRPSDSPGGFNYLYQSGDFSTL